MSLSSMIVEVQCSFAQNGTQCTVLGCTISQSDTTVTLAVVTKSTKPSIYGIFWTIFISMTLRIRAFVIQVHCVCMLIWCGNQKFYIWFNFLHIFQWCRNWDRAVLVLRCITNWENHLTFHPARISLQTFTLDSFFGAYVYEESYS